MPYMLEPDHTVEPKKAERSRNTYSLDRYLSSGPCDEPFTLVEVPYDLIVEDSQKKWTKIQVWYDQVTLLKLARRSDLAELVPGTRG